MPLGGVSRKIAQGESLEFSFQVYENSVTNKRRVIFTGETAPTGIEWSVFSLTSYTISHTTFFEEALVTLGTSIKVGDIGKLTFTPVETGAAAEGTYYGVINLIFGTDSFDVANYSVEILDETEVDVVPINEANIREEIGFDDLSENRINRAVTRACSRIQGWMNAETEEWIRKNGWPIRVSREAEHLAAILIRIEINDEDEQAVAELGRIEKVVRNMTFDTNKDDVRDTAGGTIQIIRSGSLQRHDPFQQSITNQFEKIFQ